MSSFRTTLPPFNPDFQLDHSHKWMCLGSCFASNMASRLKDAKFYCHQNPFGIQYNPLNIANCMDMICQNYQFDSEVLVEQNGVWYAFTHHSKYFHTDKSTLIKILNKSIELNRHHISQMDVFIFTFGTAFYYHHIKQNKIVANCHKLPSKTFEKKRASSVEIVAAFSKCLKTIAALNPKARFIFTVSPIRHAKDGLLENTKSKSILHLAIDEILSQFSNTYYFPSYELMMDDLRDYRFYKPDMLHPSPTAIDYIWKHFTTHLLTDPTFKIMDKIDSLKQAINHKAFHPKSDTHQTFLKKQLQKISALVDIQPHLDFSDEIDQIQGQLI